MGCRIDFPPETIHNLEYQYSCGKKKTGNRIKGHSMDRSEQLFLSVLDSVIHHKPLPEIREVSDWEGVFALARRHNLLALVFEAAAELPETAELPEYGICLQETMSTVASQAQRTAAFLELYRAFSEAGLAPLVMKGIVCRELYGEYRDHRPSGDEDLLVEKQDFERARAVLEEQRYVPEMESVTERQKEDLQEVGFYGPDAGLYIELHLNPIGHENEFRVQLEECFRDVFRNSRELTVDGLTMRTMGHDDHFLYLILHAFKHLAGEGFGIRQVLDVLLYYEKYGREIDGDRLDAMLARTEAKRFFADLVEIGNRYLGFDLGTRGRTKCPEELLEELMRNGIFGMDTQAQRTAGQMIGAAVAAGKRSGAGGTFLRTVFPSRRQLLNMHPELAERPWLLPVRWAQRWGRFMAHSRQNDGNLAKESMEIGKRRIRLLKKYGIL